MEALCSLSASIAALPFSSSRKVCSLRRRRRSPTPCHNPTFSSRLFILPPLSVRSFICNSSLGNRSSDESNNEDGELDKALRLDGTIPGTSDLFVKQVSSRAYDMRRQLKQTIDSSSYDVLEANPWREAAKPVYVLTQRANQLWTMKTRRNRSEVERELGLLFSKGRNWRSESGNKTKQPSRTAGSKFRMLVEDIREGVLVFEDEQDAAKYCDLLQGGGRGCEGVAELDASSVFDICRKMRALAVLFRRGRTPPLPNSLELNLKAKKRSLEDQEELI